MDSPVAKRQNRGTPPDDGSTKATLPPPGLIQRLPYELIANIAMSLSIEEIFDFSLCCRHFYFCNSFGVVNDAKRVILAVFGAWDRPFCKSGDVGYCFLTGRIV
ncbi:hypothetical protein PG999_004540 [Apiospora kogelbergensis]|uniref:F-box domain-containing protein n=1 Tax=Apiospora kogelbergensis TaxID=1337665 RepID=A0AAW0QZN2_9PEZI